MTSSRNRARARQRFVAAAAVFFFALAVAATGAGFAYRAQQEAVRAEQQAVAERDNATRSFKLAQKTAEGLVFKIAQGLGNVQGMRAETVRKILETAAATFEALGRQLPPISVSKAAARRCWRSSATPT